MTHLGIGGTLGVDANLAGAVDRLVNRRQYMTPKQLQEQQKNRQDEKQTSSQTRKDTGTSTAGTANIYSSQYSQRSLSIVTSIESSDLLPYVTVITNICKVLMATMQTIANAQSIDVLLDNGDSRNITDAVGNSFVTKTGKILQVIEQTFRYSGDDKEESNDVDYLSGRKI
ncbi:MAG: hypothetical protein EZS28_001237 [Streblomastix strix]|uniref:Uncharacterized protein n=1 Tax=Streblomastix strix TaxID=222440 RepID=A0A5J4X7N3_9EUKA|nr:MAG: hypothetical protein EZS28_001237 [Streblomastix strix]